MAHVKVLLFGPLAEAYGNSESIHEIEEGFNANQLLTKMGLSEWKEKGLRCAINQNFSNFDVRRECFAPLNKLALQLNY